MKIELDFKHKIDGFPFEEKKKNQGLAVMQPNTKARYADLAEQKKRAGIEVDYIEDKLERCNYVFAFADSYRTVLDKECRKFYQKNPLVFSEEREGFIVGGAMSAGIAAIFILCGHEIAFNRGGGLGCLMVGGLVVALGFYFALKSAMMMRKGVTMSWYGGSGYKAKPSDFLNVFKNDKNLKELWFKEKNKKMRMSQKSYQNKEKALQQINAYHETRNWLQQWSEGDLDRLHKVEWQALCGITKRYSKYLTPVTVGSRDKFTAPSLFNRIWNRLWNLN